MLEPRTANATNSAQKRGALPKGRLERFLKNGTFACQTNGSVVSCSGWCGERDVAPGVKGEEEFFREGLSYWSRG